MLTACKPLILLDFHKSFNDTPTKNPQSIEKQWVADFSYSLFTLNSLDNALDFQITLKIKRVHFFKGPKKAEHAAASSVPQAEIPALSSNARNIRGNRYR